MEGGGYGACCCYPSGCGGLRWRVHWILKRCVDNIPTSSIVLREVRAIEDVGSILMMSSQSYLRSCLVSPAFVSARSAPASFA